MNLWKKVWSAEFINLFSVKWTSHGSVFIVFCQLLWNTLHISVLLFSVLVTMSSLQLCLFEDARLEYDCSDKTLVLWYTV